MRKFLNYIKLRFEKIRNKLSNRKFHKLKKNVKLHFEDLTRYLKDVGNENEIIKTYTNQILFDFNLKIFLIKPELVLYKGRQVILLRTYYLPEYPIKKELITILEIDIIIFPNGKTLFRKSKNQIIDFKSSYINELGLWFEKKLK